MAVVSQTSGSTFSPATPQVSTEGYDAAIEKMPRRDCPLLFADPLGKNCEYEGNRTQDFFAWSLKSVSQHRRSCSGASRPRHSSLTPFLRLLTLRLRPCSVTLSHVLSSLH